jgi:hypothetical protein
MIASKGASSILMSIYCLFASFDLKSLDVKMNQLLELAGNVKVSFWTPFQLFPAPGSTFFL